MMVRINLNIPSFKRIEIEKIIRESDIDCELSDRYSIDYVNGGDDPPKIHDGFVLLFEYKEDAVMFKLAYDD